MPAGSGTADTPPVRMTLSMPTYSELKLLFP